MSIVTKVSPWFSKCSVKLHSRSNVETQKKKQAYLESHAREIVDEAIDGLSQTRVAHPRVGVLIHLDLPHHHDFVVTVLIHLDLVVTLLASSNLLLRTVVGRGTVHLGRRVLDQERKYDA